MCRDLEGKEFFSSFFYLLNARIAELENFIAILADQMIMLLVRIRSFKLGLVAAELVACDQPAFQQKLDRIVQCRTADAVFFIFHKNIQRLNIKMPALRIDLIQDRKTFRGFPVALFSEVIGKNIFNGFPDIAVRHGRK